MMKRSMTAAAIAALALVVGCSREQEAEIEEEMPVAAPAPEITEPQDSMPAVTDVTTDTTVGAVP
jgi:hypothetical protein